MNLEKTVKLLILDEGYKQYPYDDGEGNITIGIGDNLSAKGLTMEDAKKIYPNGISIEKAKEDLITEINSLNLKLQKYLSFFSNLDDVRQAVLINMAYQNGLKGLYGFKDMIIALKDKNYNKASYEISNSVDARKFKNRYKRLQEMMLTGNWQT